MSRGRNHLSLVIDDVLEQAQTSSRRRAAESQAIKVAAAQPRTDLACGLHALADTTRNHVDDVTYNDLVGAL